MKLVPPTDPALWVNAEQVTDVAQVRPHIEGMARLLAKKGGLALSAPQVGISLRFFIVRGLERKPFINPGFYNLDRSIETDTEGCLTWPQRITTVVRWAAIMAHWQTLEGVRRTLVLQGREARVWQHECDHLDGKCIFERPGTTRVRGYKADIVIVDEYPLPPSLEEYLRNASK